MRYRTFIATLSIILPLTVLGQSERSLLRRGNKEFKKDQFIDAEISYRSSLEKNPTSVKGNFNLGDALYKQDKIDESISTFEEIAGSGNISADIRSKAHYNMGNAHFKQDKLEEAAEAYKNALRLDPNDTEAKFNLSEVLRRLKEQQNQQQNNGDGQNQDNKQDKQDKNQDDQQNKQDDQKNQQDDKNQQNKPQNEKPQEQNISPEDAQRMLDAIQKDEKDVQQRVLEQQAKQAKTKVEKNW